MSKKTTTEVNMTHLPALILGGILLIAALAHGGLGLLFFLGACIASAYMNYQTIYKFFEDAKLGHPSEWNQEHRSETMAPYLFGCFIGTIVAILIAAAISAMVWDNMIVFVAVLALYHWMLSNYADRYGYKKEES